MLLVFSALRYSNSLLVSCLYSAGILVSCGFLDCILLICGFSNILLVFWWYPGGIHFGILLLLHSLFEWYYVDPQSGILLAFWYPAHMLLVF